MNETSHAIVQNDHNTDIVMGVNGEHMVDEKDDSGGDDDDSNDDDISMCVWWVQERLSAPFTYMYSSTIYRGSASFPATHCLTYHPCLSTSSSSLTILAYHHLSSLTILACHHHHHHYYAKIGLRLARPSEYLTSHLRRSARK